MADITIDDITNATSTESGTGVFDVLMGSVEIKLESQFEESRITGNDYATVYLGALQAVLQHSIAFVLAEQEASKKIELLSQQILKAQEEVDLAIAQTAKVYEDITASQQDTSRKNVLNNNQVAEVQAKTLLLSKKVLTELAETIDPTGGILLAKLNLMQAQGLGFSNDTKQKLLKQFLEGYAVNLSISGVANVPEAVRDGSIDQLAQDILNSLDDNPIQIQSTVQLPEDETFTEVAP